MFNEVVRGMGRLLASFYTFIPNYGVAIIFLTILVRVLMIPLAIKQAKIMEANRGNAEKMKKLQPEVKRLKEKYRDDRAKQYEEQKRLYDEHGVNMLGGLSGCLPMLLQMPIFMAMYAVLSGCNKVIGKGRKCTLGFHVPDGSALKAAIVKGHASFLGMNLNLRPSVVLHTSGLTSALPYYILIAIMGYTMWYQSRQMIKAQPVVDPQMAQSQKVMQFMPLMLVFASLNFPAGLTVYWSATNIFAIAQQFVLMRRYGPLKNGQAKDGAGTDKAKPSPTASGNGKAAGGKTPAKPEPGDSAKPAPAKQAPGKATPAKATPAKATPAKATPAKATPAKGTPAKGTPAKAAPAKPAAKAGASGASGSKPAPAPAKPAASKSPSTGSRPLNGKNPGSGARRPAAQRARSTNGPRPAGPAKPAAAKSDGAPKAPVADNADGVVPSAAARPKGSGARKRNRGGPR